MAELPEFQIEIETPLKGHKVVIKTALTGQEYEDVENARYKHMTTKDGVSMEVVDMTSMVRSARHQLLKNSVVSIDGDPTDCFKRLQKMYQQDYQFVFDKITEEQKKSGMTPIVGLV